MHFSPFNPAIGSGRRAGWNFTGPLLGLWLVAWVTAPAAPPAPGVPEYDAKASYLLVFTRYVEWPQTRFAGENSPIIIGVLGHNPFGDLLEKKTRGQRSQNRPIEIRQVNTLEAAAACHVLFISRQEARQQPAWLARLRNLPVLTVAETAGALAQGAIVGFVDEPAAGGARLRFDASLPAMEQAGLRISSPMLVSARQVHRSNKEGG
jgi:hypothetical protein